MTVITATEFKAKCLHLLDEVQRTGQDLVISKRGRPVARVVAEKARGQFGADVGFNFFALGGHVKTRGAVEAVAIEEGHGGDAAFFGGGDQGFGQGSAFKEAESGAGVEFDVGHGMSLVVVKIFTTEVTEGTEKNLKNCKVLSLIKYSFYEPLAAEAIVIDAIEAEAGGGLDGDVPLFARPGGGAPPVAGTGPGAGGGEHWTRATPEADGVRLLAVEFNGGFESGAEEAEGDGGGGRT